MDCLDNIIGISETVCECVINGNEPADYNESNSGIFLDQLDGFNIIMASAADDCARGGIWERAERAIRNAKNDYIRNTLTCIGVNYKPRIEPWKGILGEANYSGTLNITNSFAGQKLMPIQAKGAYLTLKRIGVIVNASVPVTVKVYSNENGGTLVYTSTPINAVANTLTWATLATPLELPMWSYNVTRIQYYVMFVMDGTFQPKSNLKDCGCGSVKRPWLRWVDFSGTKGNDVTQIDNFTETKELNGMILDVEIKCNQSDVICNSETPMDFTNDVRMMNMAYAIRFRAAALLYEEILNTGNINRYTLLNRDYMFNKIKEWNGEFINWVNYNCEHITLDVNDCFTCKDTNTTLIMNNVIV